MNDKLGRFGWGAVAVDGFIPPRAFQEFQAAGILPIAAEIRTSEHVEYTPAPDIIHEAAGHAPILPEPTFAAYLRRIGEVGAQAFTVPADAAVYTAIYELSEVKERPDATAEEVERAERALAEALANGTVVSEAARLSRLYWWTAEYGLFGTPEQYTLYGAGLLSSIGESRSCHATEVRKLPLDEGCVEVDYDITRPQPQLFVTPDFETLHAVLDRVAEGLAVRRGGAYALRTALESRELATLRFSSGAIAIGVLARVLGPFDAPWAVELSGPVGFGWDGRLLPEHFPNAHADCWVIVGRLADGSSPDTGLVGASPSSRRTSIEFVSGARVEGRIVRREGLPDGRTACLELEAARIVLPRSAPRELARFTLLCAGDFVTARAGAADGAYHGETQYSGVRVPRPRPNRASTRSAASAPPPGPSTH